MHSTDNSLQLNHNGISLHFMISCITMFDNCKHLEVLNSVHRIRVCDTINYTVSLCNDVYAGVCVVSLKTDGSAPRNIFSS